MKITPNNNEKTFDKNTLLVTKTNLKGEITYANRAFMNIVGMDENTLVGQAHSIIRHPDMPKIIFKLLWSYLQREEEIHAYVKNICLDGSYYWVLANVTPSLKFSVNTNQKSEVIGYHSSRRYPNEKAMQIIKPLYEKLLNTEKQGGIAASEKIMNDILKEKGVKYEEFILSF